MDEAGTRRVQLPPRSEYRIELDAGEYVAIRFVFYPISGAAQIWKYMEQHRQSIWQTSRRTRILIMQIYT